MRPGLHTDSLRERQESIQLSRFRRTLQTAGVRHEERVAAATVEWLLSVRSMDLRRDA